MLARGADDQVGVGLVGEVEPGPDGLLVDLVGRDPVGHQPPDGVDDLGPAPVVEGHGQGAPPVAGGQLDRLVHAPQHPLGHPPVAAAGEPDPDPLLVQLVAPAHQQALVEPHQVADLVGRPAPVLGGEGVHGDPGDAEVEGPLHRVEQGGLTGGVALGAGQAPAGRPPAVAVHDAGHVGGDRARRPGRPPPRWPGPAPGLSSAPTCSRCTLRTYRLAGADPCPAGRYRPPVPDGRARTLSAGAVGH